MLNNDIKILRCVRARPAAVRTAVLMVSDKLRLLSCCFGLTHHVSPEGRGSGDSLRPENDSNFFVPVVQCMYFILLLNMILIRTCNRDMDRNAPPPQHNTQDRMLQQEGRPGNGLCSAGVAMNSGHILVISGNE